MVKQPSPLGGCVKEMGMGKKLSRKGDSVKRHLDEITTNCYRERKKKKKDASLSILPKREPEGLRLKNNHPRGILEKIWAFGRGPV